MRKFIMTMIVSLSCISLSQGQVLISLLLGDKLNSEKLEFGLVGGATFTSIGNIPDAKYRPGFHLGFYFDFKFQDPLSIYTGVIVKSSMGAKGLAPYAVGDTSLDPILAEGAVERKLSYFNIPVLLRYRFYEYFFVEGGIQLGLLHQAADEFVVSVQDKDDLEYTNSIRDEYKSLDFGLAGGLGYQLMQGKGVSIGARYYGGLIDILKEGTGDPQHNSAFYIFASIPIGGEKNNSDE